MDAKRKLFVVVGAVAVIGTAAIGGGELFFADPQTSGITRTSSSQPATSQSAASASSPAQTSTPATSGSYKNGTYTASSLYYVPHGNQNLIKTSLTISNGSVTAVSVSDDYSDRESQSYIDWFEQELNAAVVGKPLAHLSPSRIGGASLTTGAFNQTLDTIRNDATS